MKRSLLWTKTDRGSRSCFRWRVVGAMAETIETTRASERSAAADISGILAGFLSLEQQHERLVAGAGDW